MGKLTKRTFSLEEFVPLLRRTMDPRYTIELWAFNDGRTGESQKVLMVDPGESMTMLMPSRFKRSHWFVKCTDLKTLESLGFKFRVAGKGAVLTAGRKKYRLSVFVISGKGKTMNNKPRMIRTIKAKQI